MRTVMSEMGRAIVGSGVVQGSPAGRAEKAAQEAVASRCWKM